MGEWSENKINTGKEKGIYIYKNKEYYIGRLNEMSKRHQVSGQYIYKNGDVYSGEWRYDMKEGQGKYYYSETGDVYKGQWKGGLKEGQGSLYFQNKNIYFGLFGNNQTVEEVGVVEDYQGQ